MIKFVKNGVVFSVFERDGETYLCTGKNVTGELKFEFVGEVADYCSVVGATSVVSGRGTVNELYEKWLATTSFHREVLGVVY